MTSHNISYVKGLFDKMGNKEGFCFLEDFLNSKTIEERETCHERYIVRFALGHALSRLESTRKHKKRTFGVEELIQSLQKINSESFIDFYSFHDEKHIGTCFVYGDELIGFEFVSRGGTNTQPGLDVGLLNK